MNHALWTQNVTETDPTLVRRNANRIISIPSAIAVLGPKNSAASQVALPILNLAQPGPLVMISPTSPYPGLTQKVASNPSEPDIYFPSGIRSFVRIMPNDNVMAAAASRFIRTLGKKTVYLLDDGGSYGRGLSEAMLAAAVAENLIVTGNSTISRTDFSTYPPVMQTVSTSYQNGPPDAIFFAMESIPALSPLLRAKSSSGAASATSLGGSGFMSPSFLSNAGSYGEGVYACIAGAPVSTFPPRGQQFFQDFQAKFGAGDDLLKTINAYEAMSVLLAAIENVCSSGGDPSDRRTIRDAVFAIKDFSYALPSWSFDPSGDTTTVGANWFIDRGGKWVPA